MMNYKDSYTPIDPDFYEIFEKMIQEKRSGKIFFFDSNNELEEASGHIKFLVKDAQAEFVEVSDQQKVRLDKIITLFGKPGPAYDEYDRFANACLTCEDLGQF